MGVITKTNVLGKWNKLFFLHGVSFRETHTFISSVFLRTEEQA